MKLLFDQNISFRIVKKIYKLFPDSEQVRTLGLENKSDKEIWEFAKENQFTIVTFDADFYEYSLVWGSPPKIIWIRTSNQTTSSVENIIRKHHDSIHSFVTKSNLACFEIIEYSK